MAVPILGTISGRRGRQEWTMAVSGRGPDLGPLPQLDSNRRCPQRVIVHQSVSWFTSLPPWVPTAEFTPSAPAPMV